MWLDRCIVLGRLEAEIEILVDSYWRTPCRRAQRFLAG